MTPTLNSRAGSSKNVARVILKTILISGVVMVACTNPKFGPKVVRAWMRHNKWKKEREEEAMRYYGAFYYLRKRGMVNVGYQGNQMYISLTREGRKKAGKYQIDDLKIKKPKVWDGRWRILIFDVKDKQKAKREALRGKLKELGFYQLQKSVWICPYEFKEQIRLLREFFGFVEDELRIIVATEIGDDTPARDFFGLED